ncbi:MAG TPA: PQQ-binding-like beta-propeller repeat protein [Abditibacteriaceae bacterium]|jgi:outer membrane protein assembly factor BamB
MTRFRFLWVVPFFALGNIAHAQDAAPVAGTANGSTSRWTTFKGDVHQTGSSNARVAFPVNLIWRYSSDEAAQGNPTSPLVSGPASLRRVYFSTGRAIHCIDAASGTQLWKTSLTAYARAPISLLEGNDGGDLVLVTTTSGTINAMRASDGTVVWTAETRAPVAGIAPVPVRLAAGPRLLQATSTGHLYAFGLDGTKVEDFDVRIGRTGATPTSTPSISRDGRTAFIAAQDKSLYAVSLEDGSVSWQSNLRATAYQSPVPVGDSVIAQVNNELVAVFEADGQPKWRTDLKTPLLPPIAVREVNGKQVIFAGTARGQFFAVNAEDGETLWKTEVEAPLTGTPLALPNAVLVGTRNGMLVALSPTDGKILWRYRLHTERAVAQQAADTGRGGRGGRNQRRDDGLVASRVAPEMRVYAITSAPAAVDGQIYVIGDNAALYALDSMPFDAEAPRAINPSIAVRGAEGAFISQRASSARPVLIPGRAPVHFTTELSDPGSGIDTASIRVSLNGVELPKNKIVFQPATGLLTAILADVDPGQNVVLPDAVYSVSVVARDLRGNILTTSASFTVDKSMPAPTQRPRFQRGGGDGEDGGRGRRGEEEQPLPEPGIGEEEQPVPTPEGEEI